MTASSALISPRLRRSSTSLRAGVRLGSLIPVQARDKVNAHMREHGIPFDVGQLKPENLEVLIEQLNDLTVDVDQEKTKVRVFCE